VTIAIIDSPGMKEYDFGPGHPFRGDRFEIFPPFLRQRLPEDNRYRMVSAAPATEEDLLLICSREYIDFTTRYYRAAALGLHSPGYDFYRYHSGDNAPVGRPGQIEQAARLMVGQAKKACDLIQSGEYRKVVVLGGGSHHAKPSYGEGFCIYNDVAFAGRYLMEHHKVERLLILDTDAHAGNGTCEYFYEEPRVLFIDLHQDPRTLYPGTGYAHEIGRGRGRGFTINVPMPPLAGFDSYRLVFESIVEPVAAEFRPQVIIRNGGSDPHFSDGLTRLGMNVAGFRMIGEKVRKMAEACRGRHIDLIGSGYNRTVLPYCWLSLIAGLAGFDLEVEEPEPVPARYRHDQVLEETGKVVDEVRRHLRDYWACFR